MTGGEIAALVEEYWDLCASHRIGPVVDLNVGMRIRDIRSQLNDIGVDVCAKRFDPIRNKIIESWEALYRGRLEIFPLYGGSTPPSLRSMLYAEDTSTDGRGNG